MSRGMGMVYRKTTAGQHELAERRGAVPLRARSVLVMVNGQDPVQRLVEKLGQGALEVIAQLLQLGMIEPVTGPAAPRATDPRPRPQIGRAHV